MNLPAIFTPVDSKKMLRSPHFFIILLVVAALFIVYYQWQDWFPWFYTYFIFEYKNYMIGLSFIVFFLYASIVFWWRGSLVVSTIWLLSILPLLMYYRWTHTDLLLRNLLYIVTPMGIVAAIALEMNWRNKTRKLMMDRETERKNYIAQIMSSHEDERKVIAQELHDGLIQELFVMGNTLRTLNQRLTGSADDKDTKDLKSLMNSTDQLIKDTRRLCLDLRPSIIDDIGFVPSLKWLSNRLNQDTNIVSELTIKGTIIKLPTEIEATIFRIAQEAINNIRKHSNATTASIFVCLKSEIN